MRCRVIMFLRFKLTLKSTKFEYILLFPIECRISVVVISKTVKEKRPNEHRKNGLVHSIGFDNFSFKVRSNNRRSWRTYKLSKKNEKKVYLF